LKSLGISITHNALSAVLWEHTLLSSRMEGSCEVPCAEPYGRAEDIARLAEEVRKIAGPGPLPSAVLSLPPAWTFLRRVRLPVTDLPRAKKMHLAELEGNLPIEDEEILSDILPAGEPGVFLAIAARRSAVEKAVAAFTEGGFRLDRAITDHVSLLCAVLSSKNGFSGLVFSDLNDLVALRLSGGAVASARQFPAAIAANPEELGTGIREILDADAHGASPQASVVFGDFPASLAELLPHPDPFVLPGVAGNASPLAYGAALAPYFDRETGNFSLRTSAEAESERARERSRVRIAAAVAVIAVLSLVGAIQVAQWAVGKKVSQIRAQIRKEFTEAVPGVKVVVQETAQIREKIQSLSRQRKELGADFPEPTAMLEKVSRSLPANQNVSVRDISFDSGRLRLLGDAGSAQLVETLRTSLVAAFGPEATVTVQEAEGSARGGSVRYTILIEKGGNGRAS
jgi:type II secretion system protein L